MPPPFAFFKGSSPVLQGGVVDSPYHCPRPIHLMHNFPDTTEESRRRWEINADYWDERMGDTSNFFHCNIVRPHTEQLLDLREGDLVLDIACGTGNFSQRLAERGAVVVAFDDSETMIAHAKRRRFAYRDKISFHVCDATDYAQLRSLKQERPFDKAVSNMAVMDIADIEPLFRAVGEMLKHGGIFVFSTHHPCFTRPQDNYRTPCVHEGEAIKGQPVPGYYYHRPLQDIFRICFDAGFVIDGFFEERDDDEEYPVIMIVRLRKR
jgi:2-polyprenyl-3-methyl-5-hydroxy-6-metoxy-1,4-benzoquinol methylase